MSTRLEIKQSINVVGENMEILCVIGWGNGWNKRAHAIFNTTTCFKHTNLTDAVTLPLCLYTSILKK